MQDLVHGFIQILKGQMADFREILCFMESGGYVGALSEGAYSTALFFKLQRPAPMAVAKVAFSGMI